MHYLPEPDSLYGISTKQTVDEHTMLATDLKSKTHAVIFSKAKSKHNEVS